MRLSLPFLFILCVAALSLTITGCRNSGSCCPASCKGASHAPASTDAAPDPAAVVLEKVELDASGTLVATTASGEKFTVPGAPKWDELKLSPDKKMYGALVVKELQMNEKDPVKEVSDTLVLFERNQKVREILPGDLIRAWTFTDEGRQVVIYSGALHFAGFYHLYDVKTGKELKSVSEAELDCEKAEGWVRTLCK